MALPTKARTWFSTYLQIPIQASVAVWHQKALFEIVSQMITLGANPWTVRYSCDGVTAGTVGDGINRWTDFTKLVWNLAAHSWIVLRNVDGIEIMLSLDQTQQHTVLSSVSNSGAFTGGSTTVDPTAVDSVSIGVLNTSWSTNANNDRVVSVHQSDDGEATRWFLFRDNVPFAYAIFEKVTDPTSGALNSYACGIRASASDPLDVTDGGQVRAIETASNFASEAPCFFTTEAFVEGTMIHDQKYADARNGEIFFTSVGLFCTDVASRGPRGRLSDIYYAANPPVATGDTYPSGTAREWIQIGQWVLPHDGTVTVTA
jgi:hypothetical protein